MELPLWLREPHSFLRFLMPGILFIAFAGAFFPGTLDGATRAVSVTVSRMDIALMLWGAWVVTIGVVFNLFWRFVYFLIRPRPHPSKVVAEVLGRAGAPSMTNF